MITASIGSIVWLIPIGGGIIAWIVTYCGLNLLYGLYSFQNRPSPDKRPHQSQRLTEHEVMHRLNDGYMAAVREMADLAHEEAVDPSNSAHEHEGPVWLN